MAARGADTGVGLMAQAGRSPPTVTKCVLGMASVPENARRLASTDGGQDGVSTT